MFSTGSKGKETSQENNQASEIDVFKAEESLVFITNKNGLIFSGALVKEDCVITAATLITNIELLQQKFFVGIGKTPVDKDIKNYLHPVNDKYFDHRFINRQNMSFKSLMIMMVSSFS